MKRIIKFKADDLNYYFEENEDVIFEVDKKDLQFDVKKFYEAFFSGELDYSEIELENTLGEEKGAKRVFDTVQTLVKDIVNKLMSELGNIEIQEL